MGLNKFRGHFAGCFFSKFSFHFLFGMLIISGQSHSAEVPP